MNNKSSKHEGNNGNAYFKAQPTVQQIQLQQQQLQQLLNKQVVGQVPPNNHIPQGALVQAFPEWRRVPIQLTIPSTPGSTDGHRILSIDVPEVFLQGPHLKSILTGQVISTTMELPLAAACAYLQNHVDLAFHKHQESIFTMNSGSVNPVLLQNVAVDNRLQREGTADTSDNNSVYNNLFNKTNAIQNDRMIHQEDGPADSSDDDNDDYKSDNRSDNDIEEDDKDLEEIDDDVASGIQEEPLNSGDDISDVDITEEFQTDNVIVCQYDKVMVLKIQDMFT